MGVTRIKWVNDWLADPNLLHVPDKKFRISSNEYLSGTIHMTL